ncbi:phage baseplate assembly protein V [Acinetobacter junii]|uniref:phage baseplate assembly protein V n=1 Tax=Acinetobacter junii TaxID=40215 RepID=UPI00301AC0C3
MSNIIRQFQNLAAIGTVIAVDASAGKIRLKIDKNETDWIPIPTIAAGVVKVWRCPSLGEQFSVTAQGGELTSAVPQISLFSEENPPPTDNPDEVFIQLGEHSFVVNVATGEANFKLTKCTFDVPETIFKGKVHAEQDITSDTDVIAAGVSLVQHPHGNVMNGPSQTSAAIPTGGV